MSLTHSLTRRWLLCAAILGLAPLASLAQVEVKEITTRPSVKIQFLYYKAQNPVASVILFNGGSGSIGIFQNGQTRAGGFTPSSAPFYAQNGISVLVPDTPSDRGHLNKFRNTSEHIQDNMALVRFLRAQANVPVWVIGHSNGNLSAASLAANMKDGGPQGLVIAAATTKPIISAAHSVLEAPLGTITIPTLVIHHKDDKCQVTPFEGTQLILEQLKSTPKKELITIEGGTNTHPNACYGGETHHSFGGLIESVVTKITAWIKAN